MTKPHHWLIALAAVVILSIDGWGCGGKATEEEHTVECLCDAVPATIPASPVDAGIVDAGPRFPL